ncbi:PD-(D/E)XK nuclease family protein [Flavobacterium sp. RS13.1]|uniref:PDDEXK-like family protein n=1 Tax=Flavobacterium sp. RS13.1 TaxID=3400345 RepID=UPI003AAF42C9
MIKTDSLLQQVSIIQKKFNEIAGITGENFNIFSVLQMESDEVKTHSAIIGELLNPCGTHGQENIFLDLFVSHLKLKFNEKHENIKLSPFDKLVNEKICERTISVNNDWVNVTGGRIDIIIEDNKQIIIIETKVNAQDQDYQLIRYHNYAKKRRKRFYIFYLTKEGKILNHENKSLTDGNIEGYNFHYKDKEEYKRNLKNYEGIQNIHQCLYYPISFKDDIKQWIEKCIEKTVSLPLIRETLFQYLNLIKKITNQSTNNKMSKEIVESMKNNVISSFEISRNIEALKSDLYYNFMAHLKDYALKNEMTINADWEKKDSEFGLFFKPKSWSNNHIQICVIFEYKNYKGLYVGVSYLPELNLDDKNKIREIFRQNGFKENDWWIWKYTENCDWGDNSEIWNSIAAVESSREYKEIITIIQEILDIYPE